MRNNYNQSSKTLNHSFSWITVVLLLLVVFTANITVKAQVSAYSFTEGTEVFVPIVGGTVSTATGDDGSQNNIPIGFNFKFDGVTVTSFSINANGFIRLNATVGSNSYTNILSNTTTQRPLIAPLWDDNHVNTGSIKYLTSGVAPSRVLEVMWDGIKIGGSGSTSGSNTASFLIRLYETTNVIEIVYGGTLGTAGTLTASIGLNGNTSFLSVTPAVTSTVSSVTANNSVSAVTNLQGKKFTFAPPTCPAPTGFSAYGLTTTTAPLSWTAGGTETTWNIEYGIAPYTFTGVPTLTLTTNPATLTGINASTTYQYRIRANCGVGDESAWSATQSFTTACDVISTFPFVEGFDLTTIPACWTQQYVTTPNTNWATVTVNQDGSITPRTGARMAEFRVSSAGPETKLISPQFDLTSLTAPQLKFYYANVNWIGDIDQMSVFYKTSAAGAWIQIGATITTENASWTEYSVILPNPSATYYVAIQGKSYYARGLNIDDFEISEGPTCPSVSSINASAISSTSELIAWTNGNTETAWDIEYGVSPYTFTGTPTLALTTNPATLTLLTASTTYQYRIRANCGGSESVWSTTQSFTTACDAINTFPFIEGFDLTTIPACWTQQYVATPNLNWVTATENEDGTITPRTGAKMALFEPAVSGSITKLISPQFDLTSLTAPQLTFYYANVEFFGDVEELSVFYKTSAAGAWTQIGATITAAHDSWTEYSVILPNPSATYYVAIQGTSNWAFGLSVDDFEISEAPTCPSVSNINASAISSTSELIAWTNGNTETAWDIEYGVSPYTFTGTPTLALTTNPATLTLLTASTTYEYKVRANCGGDESTWSTIQTFTSACAAQNVPYLENFDAVIVNDLPACTSIEDLNGGSTWASYDDVIPGYTGQVLGYVTNASSLPGNDWFYTKGLNLTAGQQYDLSFKYSEFDGDYSEKLKVMYGVAPNAASMTNTLMDFPNISNEVPIEALQTFTPATTGVYYFGFHAYSLPNQYAIVIDEINIDVTPTCPKPTALGSSSITTSSSVLSWTNGGTEATWEIEYGIAPYTFTGTSMATVTTNPFTLTGLNSSTSYQVKIRANCGAGDLSPWSNAIAFTTNCIAQNVPYLQDFDGVTTPNLPICTSIQDINGGTTWITATAPTGFSGNSLKYPYSSSLPGNDWFYTNGINLIAGQSYEIKFKYGNVTTTWTEKLKVMYGTSANAGSMTNALLNFPAINSSTPLNGFASFVPATSGVYYFGFQAYSNSNQYNLYVDDISIDVAPTCPALSNIGSSSITNSSAVLSWTNGGSETSWEIEYGIAPYTFTGTAMATVTTNPYTLTGLNSSSGYQIKIRANCGAGDLSPWSSAINFNTACGVINTPTAFAEGFSTYLPNCWTQKTGTLAASSTLTGTSSAWAQDDFGNVTANSMSAKINLYGTSRKEWLISPSYDLGTAGNRALEFDLALTNWNATTSSTLGVDDIFVVVISTDNGVSWSNTNALRTWNSTTPISAAGDHVSINLAAYTGVVKFGLYAESTVSNADNDLFVDNFNIFLLSNDATLANIVPSDIGTYTPVLQPTFVASTTNYTVTLPFNPYSTLPGTAANVTATATNPGASVVITNAVDATTGTAPDNVATIVSTSSDGTTILTYTVTYVVAPASTDAYLTSLVPSVGNLSPTFTTTNTNYSVTLIMGSTGGAGIASYTASNQYAVVSIVNATDVNVTNQNVAVVTVTAEDGVTQVQYYVEYYVASSLNSDADLASITTNGTISPSFVSSITNYNVSLPYVPSGVSSLTVVTSDAFATYTINQATNVAGTSPANVATIVVTAQDGTMQTYTVTYSVLAPSSDATLSSLTTNRGTLAPAFSAGVYNYSVVLPNGSTGSANITGTVTNASATITTTVNATNVAGSAPANTAYIIVTAQNGTMLTYTVTYSVGVPSSDATLSSLTTSQGTLSPAFSAGVYSYTVNLPTGSTGIGDITGTVNNATATITADVNASNVAGTAPANTAYIVVTAQNGSTLTYTVVYSVGVGINENSNESILLNIVPNPTSGIATVNVIDNTSKAITISVVSITGQVISTDRIITNGLESNHTINLTNEAKGVYFIKVIGENSIQTKRMVTF